MTFRAVILDFGGVIMDMRWDVARTLEEGHGLEAGVLMRTLYDSEEWREVQVGRGDVDAWRRAAHSRLEAMKGAPLPPLHQQWRDSWRLIAQNVALVRALRPQYRTAILSNADATLEERLRDGLRIHDLFDTVVSSAAVGVAKPDHRAYRLAADRLGVPVAECAFVDDSERNVTAAREVGMAAVHYRVDLGHDLATQLEALGIRPATTV